jgi:hypothetical protein
VSVLNSVTSVAESPAPMPPMHATAGMTCLFVPIFGRIGTGSRTKRIPTPWTSLISLRWAFEPLSLSVSVPLFQQDSFDASASSRKPAPCDSHMVLEIGLPVWYVIVSARAILSHERTEYFRSAVALEIPE